MIFLKLFVKILFALLLLWCVLIMARRKKKGFYGLAGYHYAHRGLHGNGVPENSLKAFALAAQKGYGAELDVHLTKDGRLVVMHDESLLRTTGVDKLLCDCTARDLQKLTLEGTSEPIPYLEEVLPLFAGKTPLVIEVKTCKRNYKTLTEKICSLLAQYPDLTFCIESFDPRVLMYLQKKHPKIIRGQLSCRFSREKGKSALSRFIHSNLLLNLGTTPHFVAYQFEHRGNLSFTLCRRLWGVQEFSWTIRRPQDAEKALRAGALIIFEDFIP